MATSGPFAVGQQDYIDYMNQLWDRQNSLLTIADAANIDIDLSELQRNRTVTLGGNRTLRATNGSSARDGYQYTLRVIQDGTGSRTLTAGSGVGLGTDVNSLTVSAAAGAVDYLVFIYYHATTTLHFVGYSRGYT